MTDMDDRWGYIGLHVEDGLFKAAFVDARGEILEVDEREASVDSAPEILNTVVEIIAELKQRASHHGRTVSGAGIGMPGMVNWKSQRVEWAPDLPAIEGFRLSEDMVDRIGVPVVMDHAVRLAAYGEYRCGIGRDASNLVYIHLGTSVGAGLILDGLIYRGALGLAGQLGHMTVDPDGLECRCGNVGCLETIASGPNLVRRTKERLFRDRSSSLSSLALPGRGELTPERIAMEALDGDDFSLMMLEQTGRWVGVAIANLLNLLNLDMVILSGGVMVAGDLFLKPVIAETESRARWIPQERCRIVGSPLGGQATLIGGAMLARDLQQSGDAR